MLSLRTALLCAALVSAPTMASQASAPPAPALATFKGATVAANGTVARTLEARFSDETNVKDYGARCDGTTLDDQAFADVASVATGRVPAGVAETLPIWLAHIADKLAATLASYGAYGLTSNSAISIVIPAGKCMLSKPWSFLMRPNTALAIHGAGPGMTELGWTGDTDGIVITVKGGGVEQRSVAAPGNSVYLHDVSFVQSDTAYKTAGRAIVIQGPTARGSSVPVAPVLIDKVEFKSIAGRAHPTQEWASDLTIRDVSNVYLTHSSIFHYDYGKGTEQDINIISTQTNGFTGNAISNIWVSDSNITGGLFGVKVSGQAVQGVFIMNTPITAGGHCIHWSASGIGLSGPLYVHNSSMSCQYDGITTDYVSGVSAVENAVIDGQGVAGTSWCGICVDNTGDSSIIGNALANLPDEEYEGAGDYGTGIRLQELPTASGGSYPSTVSNNTIGTTDYGLVLAGTEIVATGNVMKIDATTASAQHCFTDQTPASEVNRPVVAASTCNGAVIEQAMNGTTHMGALTVTGAFSGGAATFSHGASITGLSLPGATVFNNRPVTTLPTTCNAGDQRFADDARKPGEAAGAGTGLMAVCSAPASGEHWTNMMGGMLTY